MTSKEFFHKIATPGQNDAHRSYPRLSADAVLLNRADDPHILTFVTEENFPDWLARQDAAEARRIVRAGFKGATGTFFPTGDGRDIVGGLGRRADRWSFSALAEQLPPGIFQLGEVYGVEFDADLAAFAFASGAYRFDAFRELSRQSPRLVWPEGADRGRVEALLSADTLARDLVNLPAESLGPRDMAETVSSLAGLYDADCDVLEGDDLLRHGYTLIHAVGRASPRLPCLIDLRWGDPSNPLVVLVGKGVCFDTGGLDMKSSLGMLDMKYDMGGAAAVIGVASAVMRYRLPIRLRMLVPAVDNAIAGNAIRQRDVIRARNGMTVEIANTDAEGRLVLAEPLAAAAADRPDLLVDVATLTGAARVALGPDITAIFSNDEALAADLIAAGDETDDPMWRLPLWQAYGQDLAGKVADLTNVADLNLGPTTQAGAIYAALFLEKFVGPGISWAHLDILAGNGRNRPGRPQGAECRGVLALFNLLCRRYPGR